MNDEDEDGHYLIRACQELERLDKDEKSQRGPSMTFGVELPKEHSPRRQRPLGLSRLQIGWSDM